MAVSNVNLSLINPDPDATKASLIAFLKSQVQFQDYNYSGPNMSALLDVLSRNTFFMSFIGNMVFNEMFLDSAQLRDSAVSRAKDLNYIPSSMESAFTSIDVAFQTSNISLFSMPKGTAFNGLNSNGSFTFSTDQPYVQASTNGYFLFPNVNIYEGTYVNEIFTIDNSIENQLFTFSNPTIDISSLTVLVSEDAGSANNYFIRKDDLFDLNGNSQVYFIQPAKGNTYSIFFGDGVLGYSPQNGAVIITSYRVTFGPKGNEVISFNLNDNLGTFNNGSITNTTITPHGNTSGGASQESIDSIKFKAPRDFQTQGTAVTSNDYKNLITKKFPQVRDINVYGGGITANSVEFGIVFVAAVGTNGNQLTQATKDSVVSYISGLNVIPQNVRMVDANNLFLDVTTTVHVNFDITNTSIDSFKTIVSNNILTFSNTYLDKFNQTFRYSVFTGDKVGIDNADEAIISNETSIKLKKFSSIIFNTNNTINLTFNNPIANVTSTQFIVNGANFFLSDTANVETANGGVVYLIGISSNGSMASSSAVGNVNYTNGSIFISSLNITQFANNSSVLAFVASPVNQDIYAYNNDVVTIDPNSLIINVAK